MNSENAEDTFGKKRKADALNLMDLQKDEIQVQKPKKAKVQAQSGQSQKSIYRFFLSQENGSLNSSQSKLEPPEQLKSIPDCNISQKSEINTSELDILFNAFLNSDQKIADKNSLEPNKSNFSKQQDLDSIHDSDNLRFTIKHDSDRSTNFLIDTKPNELASSNSIEKNSLKIDVKDKNSIQKRLNSNLPRNKAFSDSIPIISDAENDPNMNYNSLGDDNSINGTKTDLKDLNDFKFHNIDDISSIFNSSSHSPVKLSVQNDIKTSTNPKIEGLQSQNNTINHYGKPKPLEFHFTKGRITRISISTQEFSNTAQEKTKEIADSKVSKASKLSDEKVVKKPPTLESQRAQHRLTSFFTQKEKVLDLGDGKISGPIIKISSWNVNGLRSTLFRGELYGYIDKAKPDILCLQEVMVNEDELRSDPKLQKLHPDYFTYYNCCKVRPHYSGVTILTKYKPLTVKSDIGIPKHDNEGRVLTMEFEKFCLVTCYTPNAGSQLKRLEFRVNIWDPDFHSYLNDLKAKKHTVVCGDFNVALKEADATKVTATTSKTPGFSKEERESFKRFLDSGWVDTFREFYPHKVKFSRTSGDDTKYKQGCRVDYALIDLEAISAVKDSTIDNDVTGSDHCPIELMIDVSLL